MANGNNPRLHAVPKKIGRAPVWRVNKVTDSTCSWGDIDPSTLRGAIDSVTKGGGAIMLGLTSDGGAYSVCILQDSDKMKEYPHSKLECEDLLRGVTEWYVDMKL
jgi:hypothetical protein